MQIDFTKLDEQFFNHPDDVIGRFKMLMLLEQCAGYFGINDIHDYVFNEMQKIDRYDLPEEYRELRDNY